MRISQFAHSDPGAGSAPTYVGQEIDPSLDYVTGWSMVMDYILALYPASRMKSILELISGSLKNESNDDSLWPRIAVNSAKSRFQDRLCCWSQGTR
jgi:hypothetical protein